LRKSQKEPVKIGLEQLGYKKANRQKKDPLCLPAKSKDESI
jgi:hypothetical protein